MRNPEKVLTTMTPWLERRGGAQSIQMRTAEQRGWDSAVLVCSEFVRRLTDYNEELAGAIHLLLTPCLDQEEETSPDSPLAYPPLVYYNGQRGD